MKKVIFLCVLSLSLCLSKAAEEKVPAPSAAPAPSAKPALSSTDAKIAPTVASTPPHEKSQEPPVANKNETASEKPTPLPSLPPHINTTKPEVDNKTADKPAPKETAKPSSNETKVLPDKGSKDVKPEEKPKNESATEKVTEKSTEAPKVTEAPKPMHIIEKARGFDGPSFIGGIILTLGLLAIGFMGLKYYKNQTERNYHTL